MSHPYRRTFVTQTACTDEESTCVPYVLVYLAPTPHYQWHEVIATTVGWWSCRERASSQCLMSALGSCFPVSPFAHSWVCGWQWPGHVLTPKGPAPTAYRAHTCSLSGIYRPDTRSRLPLAYGQTCHSTVPTHCSQDLPYHSYQGARVYATSA